MADLTDRGLVRNARGWWVKPHEGMATWRPTLSRERRQWRLTLMAGRARVECHYCGDWLYHDTATLDHVVPLSRGGGDSLSNVILCCKSCNGRKGSKAYVDFVRTIAA